MTESRLLELSIVIRLSLIVLAVSPTILLAQMPARTKVPSAAPVQLVQGPQHMPLSDEGRTIQARIYGVPDPQLVQMNADLAALREQRARMIAMPPVDLDQLDGLLRREESLMGQIRTRNNDRLMELLRALPEPDRLTTLQNMNAAPPKKAPIVIPH
jgi:hypothetical protein